MRGSERGSTGHWGPVCARTPVGAPRTRAHARCSLPAPPACSGDNNGRWGGSYGYPTDGGLYLQAVQERVRALRPHASLVLWDGGNEVFPLALSPPPAIAAGILALLASLDPGRSYVHSTMT